MRFLIMILLLYPITGYTADYHPADTNKDWQINLEEFNAYNTAWRQGNNWQEISTPIPNTYVARAGYLYKKGNCYHENNGNAPMNWDSDRDCDGTIDSIDICPDDSNKIKVGICGCGKADAGDRDNDKTLDCVDFCPDDSNKIQPGICGCGNPDTGDRDNDKTLDCIDLCPDDPNKIKPGCGCGKADDCKYIDNQDGTVTQRNGCLMWQKRTAISMRWDEAVSYCQNLSLAGYSNWRLPTESELLYIFDHNQSGPPYINTNYFPDTRSNYWTSESGIHPDYPWASCAWIVDFNQSKWGSRLQTKSMKLNVRAVRYSECR